MLWNREKNSLKENKFWRLFYKRKFVKVTFYYQNKLSSFQSIVLKLYQTTQGPTENTNNVGKITKDHSVNTIKK